MKEIPISRFPRGAARNIFTNPQHSQSRDIFAPLFILVQVGRRGGPGVGLFEVDRNGFVDRQRQRYDRQRFADGQRPAPDGEKTPARGSRFADAVAHCERGRARRLLELEPAEQPGAASPAATQPGKTGEFRGFRGGCRLQKVAKGRGGSSEIRLGKRWPGRIFVFKAIFDWYVRICRNSLPDACDQSRFMSKHSRHVARIINEPLLLIPVP